MSRYNCKWQISARGLALVALLLSTVSVSFGAAMLKGRPGRRRFRPARRRSPSWSIPTATRAIRTQQTTESLTGTVPITWTAGDADGDALAFTILYSADDGQTWTPAVVVVGITDTIFVLNTTSLPGSVQARVRVLATDGINTAQATSAVFSVGRNGPQVAIVSPEEGSRYPATQPLHLEGMAWDPEDGLLASANMTWTDSISGPLGVGESL